MRKLKVAAVQLRCAARREDNLAHAEALVREAAAKGAHPLPNSSQSSP